VRKVRPRRQKAFLKLSFAPGECAQVDWGSFGTVAVGDTTRRLSFFVMVLCYSRMMYVQFTVSQSMEHFLGCHQNAFVHFGAVPARIMVDNLKSAVLRRITGQPPVLNPKYKDFADHCGFEIAPCAPAKGNEKGRVENGVGYVKKNFFARP
jgi:transposase